MPTAPVALRVEVPDEERNLVVLAHVDEVAVEKLFAHAPKARMIWAHTGIGGVAVERVRALLDKHPTLYGELSYRPGLTVDDGKLSAAWKALLTEKPDRFFVGSDTWTNGRWPAALHRVSGSVDRERVSLVYLGGPSPDAIIRPLVKGDVPLFQPIRAKDYIQERSKKCRLDR